LRKCALFSGFTYFSHFVPAHCAWRKINSR